ncbi:hypothetical protein LCGC14_1753040 [marine sediment metagenome]|uniref:Uncharacterized protein n=1 Tax=marine sediment metagenome TaxID=412755 RepID=A0A0F9K2R5_9ZZZZ
MIIFVVRSICQPKLRLNFIEVNDMLKDKNGKDIVLEDYEASVGVKVQVNRTGQKLWVCIDGVAVLRVKSPLIAVTKS